MGDRTPTVIISAGHVPGRDPGAIGRCGTEAELVLPLRDSLGENLRGRHVRVVCVSDELSLKETIALCKRLPHEIAVEIHLNASKSPEASGVEVFYESMKDLASLVSRRLSQTFNLRDRGAKVAAQSARKKLGFISEIPRAILIEAAFITNDTDMGKLMDAAQVELWGKTVSDVICEYLRDAGGFTME